MDFKWYVLRTISGKEKKIKDYILQEVAGVGAAEKVPQVVIPVEKRLQIRNGKKSCGRKQHDAWLYASRR